LPLVLHSENTKTIFVITPAATINETFIPDSSVQKTNVYFLVFICSAFFMHYQESLEGG